MKNVIQLQWRSIFGGMLALGVLGVTQLVPGQVSPARQRPLSALPMAARITVPGTPDWLGIGYGSVWVSSSRSNTVSRIDPLLNRVVATIPVGRQPNLGLAMGYNSVWITNCLDRTLSRIDPALNKVVDTFPVNISGEGEGSIAVGEGGIWLTTNENGTHSGTLTRIDPTTHHALAHIAVNAFSFGVAIGAGAVWVTSSGKNTVARVDPRTNKVVATITVHQSPRFLTVGENAVWVLNQGDGTVSRIDTRTNKVVATIAVDAPGSGGDIVVSNGFVWVSSNRVPVSRINPRTNKVMEQYVGGDGADSIRIGLGSLWVSDHQRNEVWRIDLRELLR